MSQGFTSSSAPRPFLSLPDVIRERIYFFVLGPDNNSQTSWITPLPVFRHMPKNLALPPEPIHDLIWVSKSVRKKRRRRLRVYDKVREEAIAAARRVAPDTCLAILATCRTILLEAWHIFYGCNTFNFSLAEDLTLFLQSIGSVRANEIRSVRLDLPPEDWDDLKAKHALGRLLRLESLEFVYNAYLSPFLISERFIPLPKIISQLRGLQSVRFVNPEDPKTDVLGWKQGMTESVSNRMDELKSRMTGKAKRPRALPPMMDLFGRLKTREQQEKSSKVWKWEEGLSYAPDLDECELSALH
ncbi:MAG: hypothetical protein LQ350_006005 [Teloschistes chrysophthalmus]|nr:MAG: hypothetical protein LQ350_006005 [Niorma chrysophthalma]